MAETYSDADMELVELPRPPIEVGALSAAQRDLQEALQTDPDAVQTKFMELYRHNPELAMSLLGTAHSAAQTGKSADKSVIETAVVLFDAFNKTRQAETDRALYGATAEESVLVETKPEKPKRIWRLWRVGAAAVLAQRRSDKFSAKDTF